VAEGHAAVCGDDAN